jgi:DNA replication initiation complex subunit (GINS family)
MGCLLLSSWDRARSVRANAQDRGKSLRSMNDSFVARNVARIIAIQEAEEMHESHSNR